MVLSPRGEGSTAIPLENFHSSLEENTPVAVMVSLHTTPLYGEHFQIQGVIIVLLSFAQLVVSIHKVSEEEVELLDGDIDVVRVDAEAGVEAVRRLLQPLAVSRLEWDGLEVFPLGRLPVEPGAS